MVGGGHRFTHREGDIKQLRAPDLFGDQQASRLGDVDDSHLSDLLAVGGTGRFAVDHHVRETPEPADSRVRKVGSVGSWLVRESDVGTDRGERAGEPSSGFLLQLARQAIVEALVRLPGAAG